jgi:hypothetical protein
MIGVFGQREMEMAAIKILDTYWSSPYDTVDPRIFVDDIEIVGFSELRRNGWMDGTSMSKDFWQRVHGR